MPVLVVVKRCALVMMLTMISPLVLLWMLVDFRRLKRVALELEPMPAEDDDLIVYRNAWERRLFWALRKIVAPVIIFIGLPLIALCGFFLWALYGDEDDDADQGLW